MPITFSPTTTGAVTANSWSQSSTGNGHRAAVRHRRGRFAQLTISPTDCRLRNGPGRQTVTKTFDISNTGNLVLTLDQGRTAGGAVRRPHAGVQGQQLSNRATPSSRQ